ncbi:twin-arginine translocation signal domain-containing protein [Candidatus Microgenomates bacterium]|nr:twin-arginine translocation signal domain-containing protein [Candidatus Microgenomates bacterium]
MRPENQQLSLFGQSRRLFLKQAATMALAAAIGGWNRSEGRIYTPNMAVDRKVPLDQLINRALFLEEQFVLEDLSGKSVYERNIRNQYTELIAEIFVQEHQADFPSMKLLEPIVWIGAEEYSRIALQQFKQNSSQMSKEEIKEVIKNEVAMTSQGHIFINFDSAFLKQEMFRDPTSPFPHGWNTLKALRTILLHEFNHLILIPKQDDVLFRIVDPQNQLQNKQVEGFRLTAKDKEGYDYFIVEYDIFDEAAVELMSISSNHKIFGSAFSSYKYSGYDITETALRLSDVLKDVGVTAEQMYDLHRKSQFKELLLLLAEKGGMKADKSTLNQSLRAGLGIVVALVKNDQILLKDYLQSVAANR